MTRKLKSSPCCLIIPFTLRFWIYPETPGYELQIRSALSQIWLRLLELARPLPDLPELPEPLKLMLLHIRRHYAQKLTLEDIAGAAGISGQAAASLFREQLQCSPRDYLKSYRVQMACQLLTRTDMPMGQIATACGFTSGSNFSLAFREEQGCTPQEYRRRHQES